MVSKTHRNPDETRHKILEAAFWEIYRRGFQGASLDEILETAGVTKGALYHHFKSKLDLGYAIVDEVIEPELARRWFNPVTEAEDPIEGLKTAVDAFAHEPVEMLRLGCPLHNLSQEMSPIDEGFRIRVERVVDRWRKAIMVALARGQERGSVRKDLNIENTANFLVASLEGGAGLTKSTQDYNTLFDSIRAGLFDYLETLRPAGAKEAA